MKITLDEFFEGFPRSRPLFDALRHTADSLGPVTLSITKSQIAFRRRKGFAWAWIPGRYLRGRTAPLVLTIVLPFRHASPRWKEIVEPSPGKFTHHLEILRLQDIDGEVRDWLQEAWLTAA